MTESALWWLFFNILSIIILAFYSMLEMACVSFNKVRLHYYVHQGDKRAKWLNYLLHHPFRLFGTTLIGVNVAMVAGSECAREFHSSIGVNPDLAPLTQVFLVVIFGELAPMFAARHYAEHVAMLGVPIVYGSARILAPALWLIGLISRLANYLFQGKTEKANIFLSQEELQKILEEHGEDVKGAESTNFYEITQNIFRLRHKTASDILLPLHVFSRLPSNATVGQMKELIKKTNADFVLIYYKKYTHIVGIAFPRELVRVADGKRIRDNTKQPWFVTEATKVPTILHQFQRNNRSVAIILDKKGQAKGLITLNDLLSEIFGESKEIAYKDKNPFIMERTFPGETTIGEFSNQFNFKLDEDESLSLSDLMEKKLGHIAEPGEAVFIDPFELCAKETSLMEIKSIVVKSKKS